eukprot:Trichotokara_eunicae@DN6274_c0_g1_i1.p1
MMVLLLPSQRDVQRHALKRSLQIVILTFAKISTQVAEFDQEPAQVLYWDVVKGTKRIFAAGMAVEILWAEKDISEKKFVTFLGRNCNRGIVELLILNLGLVYLIQNLLYCLVILPNSSKFCSQNLKTYS